jgi:hypothetical protein
MCSRYCSRVQIADRSGRNYSMPFSIQAPLQFSVSAWSACDATCGEGKRTRTVTCAPHPVFAASQDLARGVAAVCTCHCAPLPCTALVSSAVLQHAGP